jgi:hypothetical protein
MERNVISWTPENWLTVLLMVWLGGLIIAVGARVVYKAKNNG